MMFKKSLISIAVASILTGCGGGSSGGDDANYSSLSDRLALPSGDANCPTGGAAIYSGVDENGNGTLEVSERDTTDYVCNGADGADGADGHSVYAIGGENTICIDKNANAKCESSETSEAASAWVTGDAAVGITTSLASADYPLAYNDINGFILTAPPGSTNLTLASTLMLNELKYNQVIANKTTTDVNDYLTEKLGTLTAKNKNDIAIAIQKANARFNSNHPMDKNLIVAAVINKVVAGGVSGLANVATVNVTEEDIKNADAPTLNKLELSVVVEDAVDVEIAAQDTSGWVDAKDASIRSLDARNGKIIGGSHYHNGLVVMDAAAGSTAVLSPVSVITDAGHGVDSASGVSENYLRDAVLSSDASFAYVNIPKKKASSTTADTGTFGFYKAKINDDNTIATTETGTGAVKVIKIAETGGGVRLEQQVSKFAVAPDDSRIVLLNYEDSLTVYESDLSTVVISVEMEDVESMTIEDGKLFITKGEPRVHVLNLETLAEIKTIELGFTPDEVKVNHDLHIMVAFTHGHDHHGMTDIAVVKEGKVVNQGEVRFTSDSGAVSPDMTKIALFGHEESTVSIINLTIPGFSIQANYDGGTRGASWVDNDNLAIISDRNALAVINVEQTDENVNLETKVALGKAGLGPVSINGGGFMDAIIKDVKLSTNYENVSIAWSSTTPALVVGTGEDLGKGIVTRPNATDASSTGQLTANLSATFRDDTVADSVSFDTTVRKAPAELGDAKFVDAGNIGSQYMAVNSDGTIVAVSTRFENTGGERMYGFNTFKLDASGVPVATTGTAAAPKVYTATESLVGVGISGGFIIGVTKDDTDPTKARIFTVAVDAAGVMADTVTHEIAISGGNPISRGGVGFSEDKSTIAVMVFNETDSQYTAEVFTVNASSGMLAAGTLIPMDPDAVYKTYGPPAVTNDGTAVYQRTEDSVIKSVAGTPNAAEIHVNEVARVFSNDNIIFVNTYEGNVHTYDMDLSVASEKLFSTGTGGRMYAGDATATHYYIPVQRTSAEFNGIYKLSIGADGTLTEEAFTNVPERPDRLAVRGGAVYFSNRVGSNYKMGVIK